MSSTSLTRPYVERANRLGGFESDKVQARPVSNNIFAWPFPLFNFHPSRHSSLADPFFSPLPLQSATDFEQMDEQGYMAAVTPGMLLSLCEKRNIVLGWLDSIGIGIPQKCKNRKQTFPHLCS